MDVTEGQKMTDREKIKYMNEEIDRQSKYMDRIFKLREQLIIKCRRLSAKVTAKELDDAKIKVSQ